MQAIDIPSKVSRTWPSTLTFSPDGRYLVMAAWTHQVLDTATGRWLAQLKSSDHSNVQFVLGGRAIAYCDYVKAIGVSDFDTRKAKRYVLERASARGLIATPDGKTIFLLAHLFDDPKGAEVWQFDAATLERQRKFAWQKGSPWEMVGSADARWLATGRTPNDETIRVWEVPSAKPEGVTTDDRPPVAIKLKARPTRFALSADGAHLATIGTKSVTLWNAATGRELWASGKHRRGVSAAAFCPTRPLLATGDSAGNVFMWDFAGRVLARYDFGLRDVYGLTFAPDGLRCAAVGIDQVVLWDVDV
jgi:WD40 repeat protein